MWWWPLVGAALIILGVAFFNAKRVLYWEPWVAIIGLTILVSVVNTVCYGIYYVSKTTDTEVWSGVITDHYQKEEWDEWIPPQDHESCSTDAKGNRSCTTWTTPGYWQHHDADFRVKTAENGWFSPNQIPQSQHLYCPEYVGRRLNDSWPNDAGPLQKCWPKGSPTASAHTYENKVQASYSVFRHQEIDIKDYPFLPQYPLKVRDNIWVDRLVTVGMNWNQENLDQAQLALAEENARLGKPKQVNMIVVLFPGDKPSATALALQDYWEGGNKNDFVLAIGINPDGTVVWSDTFSWSEIDDLKILVRNMVLDKKQITDLVPVIRDMAGLIEAKFVRKQFAEFSYLDIAYPTWILVVDWIITIIATIFACVWMVSNDNDDPFNQHQRRQRSHYGY